MTVIEPNLPGPNLLDDHQIRTALRSLSFLRVKMEAAAQLPIESMQVHPDLRF